MIAIIIGVVVLGAVLAGPIMSDVEHPKYKVISEFEDQDIEIRQYDPMLIAEVTVSGKRDKAISEGFKQLADYIFGNNISQESISMTAPVTQQSKGNDWTVHFVMPSEYTLHNIPKPNNDSVMLKEVPVKSMIAITFSGQNTDENIKEYEQKLYDFMQQKKIVPISEASYAFYNPPWTLPPLRRNEVIIEIESISK